MSVRYNMSDVQLHGGSLIHVLSILDPDGGWYARCDEHKDYFKQMINNYLTFSNGMELMIEDAQKFIDSCPLCRPAFDAKKTRFPEGAEL